MKRVIIILMLIVMILDLVLTLAGQPSMYWKGYYQFTVERFPLAELLLLTHPLFFVAFFIFWIFLAVYAVKALKPSWAALIFGIAVILSHFWGSTSWVSKLWGKSDWLAIEGWSWYAPVIYIIILASIFGLIIYKLGFKSQNK